MGLKNVIVTGGNRGIGKAICQLLLEQHSDVRVILASRDYSRGDQAAKEILREVGSSCEGRLDVVEMDTSSEPSISKAAKEISAKYPNLYGIVNNAGVLDAPDQTVMNTNYFGPRRVNDALSGFLARPGGRIVNIASASGPMWVSSLRDRALKTKLSQPWKIKGGISELDEMAKKAEIRSDAYGASKAFLNAYTSLHAHAEKDLIINSVTPGFIASDMGKMLGATKPCCDGAVPPVYLLMSPDMDKLPTGRYYGSDSKRSPVDEYRGPGDPVYDGPDWE